MRTAAMPSRVHSQPNVTPMIDVMLVLLIIFMVVTPLVADGFRATPPAGVNVTEHPDDEGEAVIGIDDRGQLYLNRKPLKLEDLRIALEERFQTRPSDRVVYLRAHRGTEYRRVQETLEVAERAGARVVGLVTEVETGQSPRRTAPGI